MSDTKKDACPTCGPGRVEQHPRRPGVIRCANCKEWLYPAEPDAPAEACCQMYRGWHSERCGRNE